MQMTTIFAAVILAGCSLASSTNDPAGSADVMGAVLQADGRPLSRAKVAIKCGNSAVITVPTDTTGTFHASLTVSPEILRNSHGSVLCQFGAPDSLNARIRRDVFVAFVAEGLPHQLQVVELRE